METNCFSIVILSAGDIKKLNRTLDSLSQQTLKKFEFLVLLTNQNFNFKIFDDFFKKKIKTLNFNGNPGKKLNCAVQTTSGRYIIFLQEGDVFTHHNTLQSLSLKLTEDISLTNIFLKNLSSGYTLLEYPSDLKLPFWFNEKLAPQSVIFPKSVFKDIGLFDETLDHLPITEFILRATAKGIRLKHLNEAILICNSHSFNLFDPPKIPNLDDLIQQEKQLILKKSFTHLFHRISLRKLQLFTSISKLNPLIKSFLKMFINPCDNLIPQDQKNLYIFYSSIPNVLEKRLRVLILSTYESKGGAAVAAKRLHQALLKQGVDSRMLVAHGSPLNKTIYRVPIKNNLRRLRAIFFIFLEKFLMLLINSKKDLRSLALESKWNVIESIRRHKPDLVHIHWVCDYFLSLSDYNKIKTPIAWTFHDMWNFCASEHLSNDIQYRKGYFLQRSDFFVLKIVDQWIWKKKFHAFKKLKNHCKVIAPSTWLKDCVEKSYIFKDFSTELIPHGLDLHQFTPQNTYESRKLFNLPLNKKVILFGAADPSKDPNKGFDLLLKALSHLKNHYPEIDFCLAVFGDLNESIEINLPFDIFSFGIFKSPYELIPLYSAADVMAVPSRIESFGQTALEAMACGKPVVCFKTSGLQDIVEHRKTGYLAQPFDSNDLAAGIYWTLESTERTNELGQSARALVCSKFSDEILAKKHIEAYKELLTSFKKNTSN